MDQYVEIDPLVVFMLNDNHLKTTKSYHTHFIQAILSVNSENDKSAQIDKF